MAATSPSTNIASSPLFHAKLLVNSLSFPHLYLPLPKTPFKPLKLKPSRLSKFIPPFSPSHSHRAFAALDDSFQAENKEEEDNQVSETEKNEQEEEESRERGSTEEGRLYVGNLPYSMTSPQLEEVFLEAGRVLNVEVIYDRVTDRSRGFGFVTMGSLEEAEQAIKMFNGTQVGGRIVRVNFPEVPKGGEREVMTPRIRSTYKGFIDSPHKIYAGNLGWRLTSEGLRGAFAEQRGLLSAKVIYERDMGRSRGFGFVSFESAEDAEAALGAMNGVEVEGRPLRLNLAAERARPPSPQGHTENNLESSELLSSINA